MIAEAIARYMEERGIRPGFLCERTGLTQRCIRLALRGQRKLSLDEYEKICLALGVPYEYFFLHAPTKCDINA